jgi:hypothetical protein
MSVTALDLSVVTIESLVAQDISDYSLRRARAAADRPAARAPLPVEPAPVDLAHHPHRAAAGRRLAQVH